MNAIGLTFIVFFVGGLFGCTFKEYKNQDAPETLSVQSNFSSLQAKIFTKKCISCHSGPTAPHSVVCTSYDEMMSSKIFPPFIVPGNPEASSLYKVVRDGSMPKDSKPLSNYEIQAIYEWIKNGAKRFEEQPAPLPSSTPSGPGCEPGEPGCDEQSEPCDIKSYLNEPGIKKCV